MKLGVDIGGVIIERGNGADDTFFLGKYTETPALEGAIDALRRLKQRFGGEVYLISKCGAKTEAKTREWLEANNFYSLTGLPEDNLRFCRERPEKAQICKELGITHYIDDNMDVLVPMMLENTKIRLDDGKIISVPATGRVEHLYLFRPTEYGIGEHGDKLNKVKILNNWGEAEEEIKKSCLIDFGLNHLRAFQMTSSDINGMSWASAKPNYLSVLKSHIENMSAYENISKGEKDWLDAFVAIEKELSDAPLDEDAVFIAFNKAAKRLKVLCDSEDFAPVLKEKRERNYDEMDPVKWIEIISGGVMVKIGGIEIPYDLLTEEQKKKFWKESGKKL